MSKQLMQTIQFGIELPVLPPNTNPNVLIQQQLAQIREENKKGILASLYNQWRAGIIAAHNDLKEMTEDYGMTEVYSNFQHNGRRLHMKTLPQPLQTELGDRVKINLKQRQLKEISQSGWNSLMKLDIDNVGVVIGIQAPDPIQAIVYYEKSGRSWVLDTRALEKVAIADKEDGQKSESSFPDLKVGECVKIDEKIPQYVITAMQNLLSLSARTAVVCRDSVQKLLSLGNDKVATVSIDQYKSIKVHAGLLSSKRSNLREVNHPPLFPKKYAIGKQYLVKCDIENMIKLPLWTFYHTKILDQPGTICYHGQNGEMGIKVDGEGYLITSDYLCRKWKLKRDGRQRRKSGDKLPFESPAFPYYVGQIVQVNVGSTEKCERVLKDLGISQNFLKVIQEECGIFLGYDAQGLGHVEFQIPVLNHCVNRRYILKVPVENLKYATDAKTSLHLEILDSITSLKVNDKVSLYGARYNQFVREELARLSATEDIMNTMTSNVKLIAFDDENDQAILQDETGKLFACPTIYLSSACPDLSASTAKKTPSTADNSPENERSQHDRSSLAEAASPKLPAKLNEEDPSLEIGSHKGDVIENPTLITLRSLNLQASDDEDDDEEEIDPSPPPVDSSSASLGPSPAAGQSTRIIEAPATISYNPTTKDISVKGNLGIRPQLGVPTVDVLSRQNSSMPTTAEDEKLETIGGSQNAFNFLNCNFHGTSNFGAVAGAPSESGNA